MKKTLGILFLCVIWTTHQSNAQLLPTNLQLIVRNELGNVVEGAKVKIYSTEADYDADENVLMEGVTDEKGKVIFKKLRPAVYYMNVEKGELSNMGRGVKTNKLKARRKNIVNVIIE